ncbi:GDSL-type esterase/lipase family protein [Roseomonas sp. GC11]|uniref:GDSL-type esterase/lipase family protein n=1 Tax=Roseomonas sp. GC11 TaxID=2950546 RepID=UPI00210AEC31|nr:GDSL-type esterase/lipase family protein [Roseomonas sp. GC11]MCQ4159163.1 GDSL-type esterase/lipase family protein [Roseomonas sp. GC11]
MSARRPGLMALLSLGVALLAGGGAAWAQPACPTLPARSPMPREATPDYLAEPSWRGRVAELDRQIAATDMARVQTVFLGDSLVQGWFPAIFQQFYAHRAAANLGVGGDFTQGLLARLAQGHWPASLRPRLAVILIGTNNLQYGGAPADVALGIAEAVRFIRARSPQTRILLVGLLPRGDTAAEPLRRGIEQVNALIARCADQSHVFFSDAGTLLVDGQGRLSRDIAFDSLHLTMVGYALLSAGLEAQIRQILALP